MGIVGKIFGNIRIKASMTVAALLSFFKGKKAPLKDKKKMLLIGAGAMVGLMLIGVLSAVLFTNISRKSQTRAAFELAESFKPLSIDPDELFWPLEPDFIPKIQLGRRPRGYWTETDAVSYWIDPNKNYREKWKERISYTIDEIMENVP